MKSAPRTILILTALITSLSLVACSKKIDAVSEEASTNLSSRISGFFINNNGNFKAEAEAPVGAAAGTVSVTSDPTANGSRTVNQSNKGLTEANTGTHANTAQQVSSSALSATPKGRQLVRTAELTFTVKDVYLASLAIEDVLAEHNGFVVNSTVNRETLSQNQYPGEAGMLRNVALIQTKGELQVRLPSAQASAFVRSIAKLIDVLQVRSMSAKDVQFDLLHQQLEAARAQLTAQDLGELAHQAGRIADKNQTIAQRRQATIEANEAQLSKLMLADQVEFATITLHMTQTPFVSTSTEADFSAAQQPYKPSFAHNVAKALISGWELVLETILTLIFMWPVLLCVLGITVLLKRKTRVFNLIGDWLARKLKTNTPKDTA